MLKGQLKHEFALDYILSEGNSKNRKRTFTFVDTNTNQRFTYKITELRENKYMRFVKLMNGRDNENNFVYFAYIKLTNNSFVYKHGGAKAKVQRSAPSVILFETVMAYLRARREGRLVGGKPIPDMPQYQIWHEGVCCRCGRKLTVPNSVHDGIGPECKKMSN